MTDSAPELKFVRFKKGIRLCQTQQTVFIPERDSGMVYFTDMLTEAILGAPDDQALHGILQAGVTEIEARRKNKAASRRSCYLNLIMSLKYQSGNNPNHRQRINISKAVAILEDLRSHEYENIF